MTLQPPAKVLTLDAEYFDNPDYVMENAMISIPDLIHEQTSKSTDKFDLPGATIHNASRNGSKQLLQTIKRSQGDSYLNIMDCQTTQTNAASLAPAGFQQLLELG